MKKVATTCVRHKATQGYHMIQLLGVLLLSVMLSAFAIDFGYYFAAQNRLQTDADAAAIAATHALYRETSLNPSVRFNIAKTEASGLLTDNHPGLVLDSEDVVFGFVDPSTKIYNPQTFQTPSSSPDYSQTGGYNAAFIRVRMGQGSSNNPLNSIMANFLGIDSMDAAATSVALIDQSINSIQNGGLRPIYACEEMFKMVMQDGVPENNIVRIYGDHMEVDGIGTVAGCPLPGSGNWGFADLRNCNSDAVGQSTLNHDWFKDGYQGKVNVGECYSTQPGNFIPSITSTLDTLISNKTNFPIPMYDSWTGGGSNSQVNVSAFAGFKITGYKANGKESDRYIEGRFQKFTACPGHCTSGATGTAPGGAIVKLRLASKS